MGDEAAPASPAPAMSLAALEAGDNFLALEDELAAARRTGAREVPLGFARIPVPQAERRLPRLERAFLAEVERVVRAWNPGLEPDAEEEATRRQAAAVLDWIANDLDVLGGVREERRAMARRPAMGGEGDLRAIPARNPRSG